MDFSQSISQGCFERNSANAQKVNGLCCSDLITDTLNSHGGFAKSEA